MLLSRNIEIRRGVNPDKDYYDVTDSYLDQIIQEDTVTGERRVTHNTMGETTFTIENMERLWYRDKHFYTNADPKWSIETGSSIRPQRNTYLSEAKVKEPDDIFKLLKERYPDASNYTRQLEINEITHEREVLRKLKQLAHEEVKKTRKEEIRRAMYKGLGLDDPNDR
jgi:hypothetical protein